MSSLRDEQIEKLATKTLKPWFDGALHSATDADHKAADVWLKVRHSALDKSFTDYDTAVKAYIGIDKALRQGSSDPDVIKAAQKVEQAATVVIMLLGDMAKNVKWPAPSKLFPAVDAEHKALVAACTLIQKQTASGKIVESNTEGGAVTPREAHPPESTPHPEVRGGTLLHFHLENFEKARQAAAAAKVDYIKKKLDAKALFLQFEAYIKKIKPDYAARKINWDEEGALEKLESNPEVYEAYFRSQAK